MIGNLAEPLDKVHVAGDPKNRPSHVDFAWSAGANVTRDPRDASSRARVGRCQERPACSVSRHRASVDPGASSVTRGGASVSRHARCESRDRASADLGASSVTRGGTSVSRRGRCESRVRASADLGASSVTRGGASVSRRGRRDSRDAPSAEVGGRRLEVDYAKNAFTASITQVCASSDRAGWKGNASAVRVASSLTGIAGSRSASKQGWRWSASG
jgi:hypothetical protein